MTFLQAAENCCFKLNYKRGDGAGTEACVAINLVRAAEYAVAHGYTQSDVQALKQVGNLPAQFSDVEGGKNVRLGPGRGSQNKCVTIPLRYFTELAAYLPPPTDLRKHSPNCLLRHIQYTKIAM